MIVNLALAGFAIAGVIGVYRVFASPTLADRVIAIDVVLVALMGGVTVDAAHNHDTTNLIFLVVLAIIGFTTTVSISRFIEHNLGEGSMTGASGANQ